MQNRVDRGNDTWPDSCVNLRGVGSGLMGNLNAIGFDAGDIGTVIITHMHPDYVGGSHVDFQRSGLPAVS